MYSDDTTYDSGRNFMHKKNDEIRIREYEKVTQHDPYLESADVGDDEENLEAPHRPNIAVNVVKNNDCIHQIKIIQGLGLALHLPHLTATVKKTKNLQ